ncbi:MAG: sodium-dependent transporter [Coriobacteriales bacterium]
MSSSDKYVEDAATEEVEKSTREHFGSRLGFILVSAGCAIGLGNVWRFPYITGEYGGAAFIIMYLVFLVILGLPIMTMEFAVGRASRASAAGAMQKLAPGKKWGWYSWVALVGNFMLMMFYTVVCGWMLDYIVKMATGTFSGMDSSAVATVFSNALANPGEQVAWMLITIALGLLVCSLGLQRGVERVSKVMMVALLFIMVLLAVRSVTLPGSAAGLEFYLVPNFGNLAQDASGNFSWAHLGDAIYAAMGQAFFTLSLGISSMEIFGSRVGKSHTLQSEALRICGLDTFVALVAGLIIFPACFAFSVNPGSGPSLVFVTLPSVFEQMPLGQLWGALFFVFMSFAALSTVIAVFENLISFVMEKWDLSRRASVVRVGILITLLSLPCALGFNVWSGVQLPGIGDIQSIEDFVVSNNLLLLGSLAYVIFCTTRHGWGWKGYLAEANTGAGVKVPAWARGWLTFGIPVLIVCILVMGYVPKIMAWAGMA